MLQVGALLPPLVHIEDGKGEERQRRRDDGVDPELARHAAVPFREVEEAHAEDCLVGLLFRR